MSKEEEPVHYTARHLLQALNKLEDNLLDRPLVLIHGKDLTKPNLVSGIIPAPIVVDQTLVEGKKPSLMALADLLLNPVANGKPPSLTGVDEKGQKIEMKTPLVHQRNDTQPIDCPFGHVQRIVTGGEGGIANVHVVKITKGTPHLHQGYDEGTGTITLGQEVHPLRPGSVAVIPAGVPHSLEAGPGQELEFVIVGTPPMAIDDERARPRKV